MVYNLNEEFHLTRKECFIISRFLETGTNVITKKVTNTGKTMRVFMNGNLIATFGEGWQSFSKALSTNDIKILYDFDLEEGLEIKFHEEAILCEKK